MVTIEIDTPTGLHLQSRATEIFEATPEEEEAAVTDDAVLAALESSEVDIMSLDDEEYDALFEDTKARLEEIVKSHKKMG